MAEEQIASRIASGSPGAVELSGQVMDVVHVDIGRAGAGFQVVEERRHGGEDLVAAGAVDIAGSVLRSMLEG